MKHPLDGARLKVIRAQEHLDCLKAEVWMYLHQQPDEVRSQPQRSPQHTWLRPTHVLPPIVPAEPPRKAENIPQEHRDLFERCGETVVQLTVTSGHTPASTDLQRIYNNVDHARSSAEVWLTEMGDRRANKEWRLEFVEWAILIFVIVGVFADFSLAFHWFDPK